MAQNYTRRLFTIFSGSFMVSSQRRTTSITPHSHHIQLHKRTKMMSGQVFAQANRLPPKIIQCFPTQWQQGQTPDTDEVAVGIE